jgi:ABC-type polysaccharide/polyol phosphate export permease
MPTRFHNATHGALWPVVRHLVQLGAGLFVGAGVLSESEITTIAGVVMSVGSLLWMFVARARPAQ